MTYIEFYDALGAAYGGFTAKLDKKLAGTERGSNEYSELMAARGSIGRARGPMFIDGTDYLAHADKCAANRYLLGNYADAFRAYPEEYRRFCEEYDDADEERRRSLAVFASLMVGIRAEFDEWYRKSASTERERAEITRRTVALWELAERVRAVARAAFIKWDLATFRADFIYAALRVPVDEISGDCGKITAEIDAISDRDVKRARMREYRDAKLVGESVAGGVGAVMFNTHRFGREANGYMAPWCAELLEKSPAYGKYTAAKASCVTETKRAELGFYAGVAAYLHDKLTEDEAKLARADEKERRELSLCLETRRVIAEKLRGIYLSRGGADLGI